MKPRRHLLTLLTGVAVLTGCAPHAPEPPAAVPAAAAAWDWSAYPEVDTLTVVVGPATLVPVRSQIIRAPEAGRLHLEVDQRNNTLDAGTVWGRLEPVGFAEEAAELERAATRLAQRRRHVQEVELPAERLRLQREIAEADQAHELLTLAEKNPELFTVAGGGLDPRLLPAGTAAQAAETARLLRARLAALDDPAQAEPAELVAAHFDLERRRTAHARRAAQNRLAMPYAGELLVPDHWLTRATGADTPPARVVPGEVLAQVRDTSRLRIRILATTTALIEAAHALPLTATVQLAGRTIEAPLVFQQIEANAQGQENLFLYFEVDAAVLGATPFPPPGLEVAARIDARLPQPARSVPKLALTLADPTGAYAAGWAAGLRQHLPGARLVAEGRTELALIPPAADAPDAPAVP